MANSEDNKKAKKLTKKAIKEYRKRIPEWRVIHEDSMDKLMRQYKFDDFEKVLSFTSLLEKLADKEDHHPSLKSSWGKVTVYWWTHSEREITEKDFLLAIKCDRLYSRIINGVSENQNDE